MKKLITIILLLTAVQVFSQDTCKQYVIRGMDFSKIDTIIVPCNQIKSMQGKPLAITDTTEIINELMQVQKTYQEIYKEKVKELETKDTDLLRIQGIILYLNQKLEQERKKK